LVWWAEPYLCFARCRASSNSASPTTDRCRRAASRVASCVRNRILWGESRYGCWWTRRKLCGQSSRVHCVRVCITCVRACVRACVRCLRACVACVRALRACTGRESRCWWMRREYKKNATTPTQNTHTHKHPTHPHTHKHTQAGTHSHTQHQSTRRPTPPTRGHIYPPAPSPPSQPQRTRASSPPSPRRPPLPPPPRPPPPPPSEHT
jgi:hypothetical protein